MRLDDSVGQLRIVNRPSESCTTELPGQSSPALAAEASQRTAVDNQAEACCFAPRRQRLWKAASPGSAVGSRWLPANASAVSLCKGRISRGLPTSAVRHACAGEELLWAVDLALFAAAYTESLPLSEFAVMGRGMGNISSLVKAMRALPPSISFDMVYADSRRLSSCYINHTRVIFGPAHVSWSR